MDYSDILRSHEVAHDFLMREFSTSVKIGWNLTNRGQSSVNIKLMKMMGMESMVLGYVDEHDR